MLKAFFRWLFRLRERTVPEQRLSDRLFSNILLPSEPKDYFRWPYAK